MCMSEEPNLEYTIDPSHYDRIIKRVDKKRFKSVDYFIDQAIKVYLAWEENPEKANAVMTETPPTLEQYGFMVTQMQNMQWLKETWKTYPEDFDQEHIMKKNDGRSWKQYISENKKLFEKWEDLQRYHNLQDDHRASNRDLEQALSNLTNAQKHVKHLEIPKEIPDEFHYDGWPMLFTHYSRILPAKIGLLALGELMYKRIGTKSILNCLKEKHSTYVRK